jgi:hypothetical protein
LTAAVGFGLVLAVAAGAIALSSTVPSSKQAILDRQFSVPAGAAPPAPKNLARVPPYDPPVSGIPLEQISDRDVQAPLPPSLFVPTTQWVDVTAGIQLAVYAGSAPRAGGAVAIYVWKTDLTAGRNLPGTGLFVGDDLAGPARLTAVSGGLARFQAPSGAGAFGLDTHVFMSH